MRRIALIDNPKAGQRQHAQLREAILAALRRGGFDVEDVPTAGPGDATRLAREIAAAGWSETVLAFGGDGTVREVADGQPLAATFVAVANIPLYAGPYRLVPEARPDDGRLELLLFRGGRFASLRFAADLLLGARHVRRKDVAIVPVEEVILEGPPG